MKNTITIKLIAAYAVYTWTTSAFCHEEHGLNGSHAHPSELWMWGVLAVAVAAAVWTSRSRK